ncbi:hypothetical protein IFT48_05295 [Pseudomonas fluorescens]|uniref:hypothetical protein n=1 Tax=Pseudomonas fluorescens TaxID=294 RepID=UPI001930A09D|nr:hypothetical protein [Pseudomonas fluorescens]MBD8089392.1 hypothetical protein [Pseudomonas fluorescens]
MKHYYEFRNSAESEFLSGSLLPTQEAQLFASHWQSESFWSSLGVKLSSEPKESHRSPSERSKFSVIRDRHIQGLLDFIPHASTQHRGMILDQSLRTFREFGLLRDLSDPFTFPLTRLMSDIGPGGLSTVLSWAVCLRRHECSVAVEPDALAAERAMWLASLLVVDPLQSADAIEPFEAEAAIWLLLNRAVAQGFQGVDYQDSLGALRQLATKSEVSQFPGWPILHILNNPEGFEGVNCTPNVQAHPFEKSEMNVGQLVWDTPIPDVMSEEAWSLYLASEMSDSLHFATQIAKKHSGTVTPRINQVIKGFIADQPHTFMQVELNAKGFKNLESLGMKREVLIKHPSASRVYAEVLIGRDLGL